MARSRQARRRAARNQRQKSDAVLNSLTGLAEGLGMSQLATGGSYLSNYGTIAHSNNYALMSLNQAILTYMYAGNGLFQTAIQLPIQDGLAKGVEIECDEVDAQDIDDLWDAWDSMGLWEVVSDAMTWSRLYGGGAIIINTPEEPEKPLNIKRMNGVPFEAYAVDRWELSRSGYGSTIESRLTAVPTAEKYWFYGETVDKSRVLIINGKTAPSRIRHTLSGWGMSEGERMIRDLNLYLKTQDVTYEILDEAKIDVYKIKGLAQKLVSSQGTAAIQRRVEVANELKNYLHALVMDAEDDFEQKSMTFSGLAEVMNENRIGVASALRMPMVKLFGLSPSGFNTGDSDIENYNQMVQGEIQAKSKHVIRQLLQIVMMQTWGFIPTFTIKFPPMRELDPEIEERIKASQTNRLILMHERQLLTSKEFGLEAEKLNLVSGELAATKGVLPDFPEPLQIGEQPPEKLQVTRAPEANSGEVQR